MSVCDRLRHRRLALSAWAAFAALGAAPNALGTSRFDACIPSQVQLTITRIQNAYTGGSYAVLVKLRNVGTSECTVEGHPLVVISPHPFPLVVGDLADFDPNDPQIGPERLLHLRPRATATAAVVIGRLCDGAKAEMTPTRISLGASGKLVQLRIEACRRQGAVIYTGPFMLPS